MSSHGADWWGNPRTGRLNLVSKCQPQAGEVFESEIYLWRQHKVNSGHYIFFNLIFIDFFGGNFTSSIPNSVPRYLLLTPITSPKKKNKKKTNSKQNQQPSSHLHLSYPPTSSFTLVSLGAMVRTWYFLVNVLSKMHTQTRLGWMIFLSFWSSFYHVKIFLSHFWTLWECF